MQFPESWLRAFCNPPISTAVLAETLTMAGLEVEELKPVAPAFTKIVVGEIKTAEQHPNADRLQLTTVDVGEAEPSQRIIARLRRAARFVPFHRLYHSVELWNSYSKPNVSRKRRSIALL